MTEPTPYAAPAAYAPAAPWNVLSIVSLVSSIIGFHLVGVILGHISLGQIKRTGEQGNVLAIIGLVLGYLGLAAVLIGLIIVIASGALGLFFYNR